MVMGRKEIEEIQEFKYFGFMINNKGILKN